MKHGLLSVEVVEGPMAGERLLIPTEGDLEGAIVEIMGGPDDGGRLYLATGDPLARCEAIQFGDWDRPGIKHVYIRHGNRLVYEGATTTTRRKTCKESTT